MFGLSSYYSFIYLFLYLFSSAVVCSVGSFYIFWFFIEFIMLSLMGLMFNLVTSGFVELIVFFIVQTISSLSVFVFYVLSSPILFFGFILMNLAMFPFVSWFIFSSIKLPNMLLLLTSTFHNLPPFLLFIQFSNSFPLTLILSSVVLTCLISASFMSISADLRVFVLYSSVANTSWLLISALTSFQVFVIYFAVYCFFTFSLLRFFAGLSNITLLNLLLLVFLLLIISGFPPSPIFFTNAIVVNSLLIWISGFSFYSIGLLFSTVLLVFSYFRLIFLLLLNSHSALIWL